MKQKKGRTKCEVWSRVVGYLRPTSRWNEGKSAEFDDRKMFNVKDGKAKHKKRED